MAAALSGAGVLLVVSALRPPPTPTVTAVVAARDLAVGVVLQADDLTLATLPVGLSVAPLTSAERVTGRVLTTAVAAGEPVTEARVAGPESLGGQVRAFGSDLVGVPVRLADAGATALLRPGDHVDLWASAADGLARAAAGAERVARDVVVVAVPRPAREGGLLGAGDPASATGGLVVLAVPPLEVAALSRAVAVSRLTVTVLPAP